MFEAKDNADLGKKIRPNTRFLDRDLIEKILYEAVEILCKLGITIHNEKVLALLGDHGADVDMDKYHARLTPGIVDLALASVPPTVELFDVTGKRTHCFAERNIHFVPASSSLQVVDRHTGEARKPDSADYTAYVKTVSGLPHIAAQSTAFIPADVDEKISDSYRLYLSLLYGEKPVVTGTFTMEAFQVMHEMQVAVRGSAQALKRKPLTMFTCCPTSPLKLDWVTAANLVDCAAAGIPVEIVPVPLPGFISPVTLVGSLVEHTAETLGGIVVGQLSTPGAPMLYGGAPAPFDVRYETTPMSAIEAQMICCAYSEIGRHLGMPTQAFISLSDAKSLDAQAGMETSMGAVLASLAGINSIAGPGVLDFVNSFSIEKLVLDNEICGMMLRLTAGIEPKEDFPALPLFRELLKEKHLLIAGHTRKYLKEEHYMPGEVVDRAGRQRRQEEGNQSLMARAADGMDKLIANYRPSSLSQDVKSELTAIMLKAAKSCGMEKLPNLE